MQGNLDDLLKNLPPELARKTAQFGVKLAIDLLQTFYADLAGEGRSTLLEKPAVAKKMGRPRKIPDGEMPVVHRPAGKSGWPDDPEERRLEMMRRQEVARAKKRATLQSEGARKRWDNMSAVQKAAWLSKMQRGKKRAAKNAKTEEDAAA